MEHHEIKCIAVLGAGDMGHGIAETALIAGFKVYLRDIKQEFIDRGTARIHESLAKLVTKGKVTAQHHDRIKNELLIPLTDLEAAVKTADLVIEAIPEDMELKKKTFSIIDKAAPAHALLASNTSTMKISEMALATQRPDKVLGLHYFNPAVLMKLVEVIKGDSTSETTMKAGVEFVKRNRKIPVRVEKDVPGFIVNRVQAPAAVLLNAILDQHVAAPEQVDAVMRSLGMPMGPYETIDFTGIDISYHGSAYFARTLHPDFAMGATLTAKFHADELGKKTGKGIFNWSKGRPEIDLSRTTDQFDFMDMVAVNVNEAAKIVEAGVCSFEDVDTAVINATGNPLGLIALVKNIEPGDLAERLERLSDRYDKEIFKPARLIRKGAYR